MGQYRGWSGKYEVVYVAEDVVCIKVSGEENEIVLKLGQMRVEDCREVEHSDGRNDGRLDFVADKKAGFPEWHYCKRCNDLHVNFLRMA